MVDNGFFNEPKSLVDTAKHLYIDGKPEAEVLEEVLGELVKVRKLKQDGSFFTI